MSWSIFMVAVVLLEVLGLLVVTVPFIHRERRGWDNLEGRGGPRVLGRDTLIQTDSAVVEAIQQGQVNDA